MREVCIQRGRKQKKKHRKTRPIHLWIKSFLETESPYWITFKYHHSPQAFKVHMFKSRSRNGEIIIWYLPQTKAIKERSWREEVEPEENSVCDSRWGKVFLFQLYHILFIIWSSHLSYKISTYCTLASKHSRALIFSFVSITIVFNF